MWSVWQTCRTGRRAAGFLGGLLVALLVAAGPAMAQAEFTVLPDPISNGGATTPVVAVTSSGKIYAAWQEGPDIFFTRSLSEGSCGGALKFLTPAVNLSNVNTTQVKAGLPTIAASDEAGVIVAWRELMVGTGGVQAIRFRRSASGDLASAPIEPLQPSAFVQTSPNFPAAAADKDGFFVAWQGTVAAKPSVLVAQSLEGGGFAYANVTQDRTASATQPALASDGSRVHVVWREMFPSSGIWYRGFDRNNTGITTVGSTLAQLTGLSGTNIRLGAYGGQVTAAWIISSKDIQARTMMNGGGFGGVETIQSYGSFPTKSVTAPALSLGPSGRFVGWQETDSATFPSTVKLLYRRVGLSVLGELASGDSWTVNPAAPSAGQASVGEDGTPRFVASWQENAGTAGTVIKLAHKGSFGGGGSLRAKASTEPAQVNARTMMAKGSPRQPNLTVFIEPAEGEEWSASAIDPGSVTMNGKPALGPTALVGNKRMVKFDRSDLLEDGSYTITGNITGQSCPFSYSDKVPVTK